MWYFQQLHLISANIDLIYPALLVVRLGVNMSNRRKKENLAAVHL